jgi:hypothetical protein
MKPAVNFLIAAGMLQALEVPITQILEATDTSLDSKGLTSHYISRRPKILPSVSHAVAAT